MILEWVFVVGLTAAHPVPLTSATDYKEFRFHDKAICEKWRQDANLELASTGLMYSISECGPRLPK